MGSTSESVLVDLMLVLLVSQELHRQQGHQGQGQREQQAILIEIVAPVGLHALDMVVSETRVLRDIRPLPCRAGLAQSLLCS